MPLSDPDEFAHRMAATGFHDVTIHTASHPGTSPSLAEFWGKTQRSAVPVALLQRKLGAERWAGVANGVLDRLHETLDNGPVEEFSTMHLGAGLK